MKQSVTACIMLLCSLGLLLPACQVSTVKVDEAFMCKGFDEEGQPVNQTSAFEITDAGIHCAVKVVHVPAETELKAIWYSTDEETKERTELIQSNFKVDEDRWINFYLTPPAAGFAPGSYAVDVFLGESMSNSLNFTITGPTPSPLIKEVVLASTAAESGELTIMYNFPSTIDVIYAQVETASPPVNTVFRADWYQHDSGTNQRAKIISTDFTYTEGELINFTLTPNSPLPVGRYSVDISVGGVLSNTLMFEVQ